MVSWIPTRLEDKLLITLIRSCALMLETNCKLDYIAIAGGAHQSICTVLPPFFASLIFVMIFLMRCETTFRLTLGIVVYSVSSIVREPRHDPCTCRHIPISSVVYFTV